MRVNYKVRGYAVITTIMLIINIFVGFMSYSDASIVRNYGIIPAFVQSGERFRLITSIFVHSGIIHLVSNMGALLYCGPELEKELGCFRFLSLYLLSGLGGSVLALILSAYNSCTVGASGAIFGLMGALFLLQKNLGNKKQLGIIGQDIAVNLYYTFANESISIGAHIGGLITGLIIGAVLIKTRNKEKKTPFIGIMAIILCGICLGGNTLNSTTIKPLSNSIYLHDNRPNKAVTNERTINVEVDGSEYMNNQNITNIKRSISR